MRGIASKKPCFGPLFTTSFGVMLYRNVDAGGGKLLVRGLDEHHPVIRTRRAGSGSIVLETAERNLLPPV